MRKLKRQILRLHCLAVLDLALLASGLAFGPALAGNPDELDPDEIPGQADTIEDPASAGQPGGDCCADLAARIAELEAATAKKPRGETEITITGAVDIGLLWIGDGGKPAARLVDNANDGTSLSIEGETARFGGGEWRIAFKIEMRVSGPSTDTLDQSGNQSGDAPAFGLDLGDLNVAVTHVTYGTVTLGQLGGVSDGALDADLSSTEVVAGSQAADVGGGYWLRGATGDTTELKFADAFGHLGGLSGGGIRYDSPALGGFVLSAGALSGGGFDFGVDYQGTIAGLKLAADAGFVADSGADSGLPSNDALLGSFAVLEPRSGLNLMLAAGMRRYSGTSEYTDGSAGHLADERFIYGKLGLLQRLVEFGDTAFYVEAGRFGGGIGRDVSPETIAGLAGIAVDDACSGAGFACSVSASTADLIGLGIVQHVDSLGLQAYFGYRHQSVAIDLVDDAGTAIPNSTASQLDGVFAGVRIEF